MRAAWRARSTRSTPQVNGSSKARRSATLTAPSTTEALRISMPPFSSTSGGTLRASNFRSVMTSPVADGLRGLDHLGHRRERELLEVGRIGHGHVLAGHADHRRVEVIERVLHDAFHDLGPDAGLREA